MKVSKRERNLPALCGEWISYNRGCRCFACKAANAKYNREDRARRGKDYVRNCNLKNAHGITLHDYTKLLKEQDGKCAACGLEETGRNQYGLLPLAVDHNHTTMEIRGLLCMRCNRALGLLKDDAEIIKKLLIYRRMY